MGKNITLKASDGHELGAYRADPAGKPKGAVVVIQEVFGVNHWVRAVADSYAAQGYLAIAPAIFDRVQKDFITDDYSPEARPAVRAIAGQTKPDLVLLDVAAAIEVAKEAGKVGITGFCFGGAVCWRAANKGMGLSAVSGYYGGGIEGYIDLKPQVPTIMHYGEKDQAIPLDKVEELRKKYPEVAVYIYPADHGFHCDERGSFDAASSKLAMERTLAFFAKHIG